MINNKFDVLKDFIEGYFHQDWNLDYPDFMSVWNEYLKNTENELDHRVSLYKETKKILNSSDKEINNFLCQECDFCLGTDQEASDWMKSFNNYLSAHTEKN